MDMYNNTEDERIKNLIFSVTAAMGFAAKVKVEESLERGLVFNLDLGEESRFLIGHRGEVLQALEFLVRAIVMKAGGPEQARFALDVDDYRRKRIYYLQDRVRAAVVQMRQTGRGVALAPMDRRDRRLLHALVASGHPEVVSISQGEEPVRRVVLKFKPDYVSQPL